MWYDNLYFYEQQEGLKEFPVVDFFSRDLTPEEIKLYPDIRTIHPEFIDSNGYKVPSELTLCTELRELLEHSNGGLIVNGDREFGYFSLQDIRYYYFAYGFPKWAPHLLPIAFNGGGVFYCYDFRNPSSIKIAAAESNNLDYENTVILGKTLKEVLSKTVNIEDNLY